QPDEPSGWLGRFFIAFNRGLAWSIDRYRDTVCALIRVRWLVMGVFAFALVMTVWMYGLVPSGFVPEEDQGYFLGIVQAPDGVALNYTSEVMEEVEAIILDNPNVASTFMVRGAGFDGSGSARGLFFGTLKPWDERPNPDQSIYGVLADLNPKFQAIQGAIVAAFNAPPVSGLSTFGGFEFQLQDRSGGQLSIAEFLANAGDIIGAGNADPVLGGSVYTQFTANAPQLQIDVNRARLKALNVDFSQALSTLSVYLGSSYVNDFTLGQRSYRVYAQADQQFRAQPEQLEQYYVRSRNGNMVALNEIVTVTPISGPPTINHFNLFRSIKLQGQAAPGYSSGQAIQAMQSAYEEAALPTVGSEWTGTAREEISAGGQAVIIFGLGIVIVFLVLAAQYESYIDPLIIMLTVPLAMLGALVFLFARQLNLDVYAQVGLVMLIGLASKNAILIVEFANQSRAEGMKITEAAIYAAEQRFRPILMTAISSLVGFFPLVVATGAGSASRQSIGTVVFGGLLVATFLSLLVVPVLYIVVKTLAERVFGARPTDSGDTPLPPTPPSTPPSLPSAPEERRRSPSDVPALEPQPTPSRFVEGESPL
ncbi:MAG: efflux RND transporter permease subunit, partial [Spirulinaceae cyanobacterium RM2_2_10]|nr:efflux RND transporter permease subunit [Spirulinaceae cyanobacterium RM2_2_10]